MKINKETIRCYKFFTKFAWQTDKKYFFMVILNFMINSVAPFITIIGTQYLIDEIADRSKREMGTIIFWIAFICLGNFIYQNLNKFTSEKLAEIN